MEIKEIFENRIKIDPKVMTIDSLFNNEERVNNTNYQPPYQRNYVWDDEKATYFIESILLGTEVPPLIYFRNGNKIEVIDGRQRYQTILRYINNEFKLKKNGLQKLDNNEISNKLFKDLKIDVQDLFWDTKLRIIEFSFHTSNVIDEDMEDVVKKEIFKRYNSGITPLKVAEIDNAVYFKDDLNTYIKEKIKKDRIIARDISSILHFEKTNDEIILKKIRQLLVQHEIPIKYYAIKKEIVISKYYDYLYSKLEKENIENTYVKFIEKINLIKRIKESFTKKGGDTFNRLISECYFWAFSILDSEGILLASIKNDKINEISEYILLNLKAYSMVRSSFAKELFNRYEITSKFFAQHFEIDFSLYLYYHNDFKNQNKALDSRESEMLSFDDLRINKPEPTTTAIVDICRQMERQRFLIRPAYQRKEVINQRKSSAIIESILLGIKLPPIFVYKREDGISEVLDGQQRLLSILGYIQKPYLDENNQLRSSDKDGYSLNLRNGILNNLHTKKFSQLSPEHQERIKSFDLWVIEINYKNNKNFEPIDLFIRLNNKPYPIKEDTFEMWNSYISRDIIQTIRSIHRNNSDWFYLRKNNSRMEDENIYTALAYFQYNWIASGRQKQFTPSQLDIYKIVSKINFRVKSKNEISKLLENGDLTMNIIEAADDFEFNFLGKLKLLLCDEDNEDALVLNRNLDEIFAIDNGRRTQQGFYALWYFLFDIPISRIRKSKLKLRNDLRELFSGMAGIENKAAFDELVLGFKKKFGIDPTKEDLTETQIRFAPLGQIAIISAGSKNFLRDRERTGRSKFIHLNKGKFSNYHIDSNDLTAIEELGRFPTKEVYESKSKILIKRSIGTDFRLITAFTDEKLSFGSDTLALVVSRVRFLPKYVLGFLSSRYCYYRLVGKIANLGDLQNIGVSDIRNIQVPAIDIDFQRIVESLVDCIIECESITEISLFFQRLIDALVYEICLPEAMTSGEVSILKHLLDIPQLIHGSINEDKSLQVKSLYEELSAPSHPLGANLLKLINIRTISAIEAFNHNYG
jgi:hypothetical protein